MTDARDEGESVGRMAKAASEFLARLRPEQVARASFPIDATERENWHYVPRARKGIPRGELSPAQLDAANELMASGLSSQGLDKARAIIRHESVLGALESSEGTLRFDRLEGLYYISVFGAPRGRSPWGWRVEGHHLSLNVTVVGGDGVSATPSFFGANPAEAPSGPSRGLRILREEEDAARELLLSFDAEQTSRCIIYPAAPPDLITRASRRVELGRPVGLSADAMSGEQRTMLLRLIEVYVQRKPADVSARAMRALRSDGLASARFGWAGSPHPGRGHYYRVHAPGFLIEYDNTQNRANHIHAVWREIHGDFGRDMLREHYEGSH